MKIFSLLLVLMSFSARAQVMDSGSSAQILSAVKSYLNSHWMSCSYWSANNGGAIYEIPATQALWFLDGAEMSIDEANPTEIVLLKSKKFKKTVTKIQLDDTQSKVLGIVGETFELYPLKVNQGTITEPRFETVIRSNRVKLTRCGVFR